MLPQSGCVPAVPAAAVAQAWRPDACHTCRPGLPCLQAHDDAHQAKQGLTLQALQSGAVHLCPHPISAIQHF